MKLTPIPCMWYINCGKYGEFLLSDIENNTDNEQQFGVWWHETEDTPLSNGTYLSHDTELDTDPRYFSTLKEAVDWCKKYIGIVKKVVDKIQ